MDVPSYLFTGPVRCGCGRTHDIPIEEVVVARSVQGAISSYLERKNYRRILLVADQNTLNAFGQRLSEHLQNCQLSVGLCIFPQRHDLLPDEQSVAKVAECLDSTPYDTVLAVGSGVINDIVRYATFQAGLPYVSVATAPSVDGYASNMAAMQFDGLKVTFSAQTPQAIFADLTVLTEAPWSLVQSGFGDLVGKVISLSDWLLSRVLYNEYFCQQSFDLVYEPLVYVVQNAKRLFERNADAVQGLFTGLINSGISMAMVGNSRPCSGSEHHCSHFWDLASYQGKRHHAYHGLQVGYATHCMIRFYRETAKLRKLHAPIELQVTDEFERYAVKFYGAGAQEVVRAQRDKAAWLEQQRAARRDLALESIISALQPTLSILDDVQRALEVMGISTSLELIEITPSLLLQTFLHAKELRARYTVFDFLTGQGLLDEMAASVIGDCTK